MNEKREILIVTATQEEINPFLKSCIKLEENSNLLRCNYANTKIDFLITGLGIPFTVFYLTKVLIENNYDTVINAGISGSFIKKYKIGDVLHVVEDVFSDLGVETGNGFKTIFEENLYDKHAFPFEDGKLQNKNYLSNPVINKLPGVKGITVNTVHGRNDSIKKVIHKFKPDIETMEGAAFFYICKQFDVNCYQIRSISNKVELRNKEKWDIPLAISNLNNKLTEIIDSLNQFK